MESKVLSESFIRKGFLYDLVKRDGDVCMYSKKSIATHYIPSYDAGSEVFVVPRETRIRVVNGRPMPYGEYYPYDESFGVTAWAFGALKGSYEKALERFDLLVDKGNLKVFEGIK